MAISSTKNPREEYKVLDSTGEGRITFEVNEKTKTYTVFFHLSKEQIFFIHFRDLQEMVARFSEKLTIINHGNEKQTSTKPL